MNKSTLYKGLGLSALIGAGVGLGTHALANDSLEDSLHKNFTVPLNNLEQDQQTRNFSMFHRYNTTDNDINRGSAYSSEEKARQQQVNQEKFNQEWRDFNTRRNALTSSLREDRDKAEVEGREYNKSLAKKVGVGTALTGAGTSLLIANRKSKDKNEDIKKDYNDIY